MNLQRFKTAQDEFLSQFPGGFSNPLMQQAGKKHQLALRTQQAQAWFAPEQFGYPQQIAEHMVTLIRRSSMISMYEKPRLRDWVHAMTPQERESYAFSLNEILHGNQASGFQLMIDLLSPAKLAKWSLVTILPYYFAPQEEVFMKPNTTKGVIRYFELEGLKYTPTPDYEFYRRYRQQILEMRQQADPSLQYDNAAFTGFLMMALKSLAK